MKLLRYVLAIALPPVAIFLEYGLSSTLLIGLWTFGDLGHLKVT
jgi:uncharacterized membrane protein YqaE (UPF0057 family)